MAEGVKLGLGQIEKALQYALEAEEMALKAENARDLAKSTDILGQLYLLKGEKNTAETYFQRSSEYSSKIR